MKKLLTMIVIASLLALTFVSLVFAADKNETPEWYQDMLKWRKEQVSQSVQDGYLTKDQAEAWNEHLDSMEKWHNENGFNNPGMGYGGCRGGFGNRTGFRGGFGPGMMNNYNLQNQ